MTAIRALVLDIDGVIITGDTARVAFERDHGITPATTGSFFTGPFLDCLVGKADLKQSISPLLRGWGWQGSVQSFLDYWFAVESNLDQAVLGEVDRLRAVGPRCFLATNQERYRTKYLLHTLGLEKHFDGAYASCDVGFVKADPQFWAQLKREFSPITASEILFWDDTSANVEAARAAGFHAELYTNAEDFLTKMRLFLGD